MADLLTQLLAKSAARYPERTAVWARGRCLTYQELEQRSNQLANLLCERGVQSGDRIGLYFRKSVESVVSMFGALKAGAIYVPLDLQQPVARTAAIIGNCAVKCLITGSDRLKSLNSAAMHSVEFSIITDDGCSSQPPSNVFPWGALSSFSASQAPEHRAPKTTDLAYILYTSGSTGEPKGVMLSHQNALTFIEWCADVFQIRSEDHLSSHAPLHFDLSVFDVYNAIEAGAAVHMIPDNLLPFPAGLAEFMEKHAISVWYSVPSALVYLVLHGNLQTRDLRRLRLILFAGEVFPMKYLRQLANLLPNAELYNLYGPTETNVCTYYRVDRSRLATMERLPIGRACAHIQVFAANEHGGIIHPGQTGELYVRGLSVTRGYWGRSETHEMVVPKCFQPPFEGKLYRTGDLVVLREDGDYDFIGRCDCQIKSRGYRIELGEIEAAILSQPAVREAAAIALPDDEIGARIKAVVALHKGCSLTAMDIQQHCASRVPKYMIPEMIEFRGNLPRTSTGKIDRVQLASTKAETRESSFASPKEMYARTSAIDQGPDPPISSGGCPAQGPRRPDGRRVPDGQWSN